MLIYSPMIGFNFGATNCGAAFASGPHASGHEDCHFSHQQLVDVLEFHQTPRACAQFERHDNPMHRMFGGMPFKADLSGSTMGGTFTGGDFFSFGST